MKSKTLYNGNGEKVGGEISVELHGISGERGIRCLQTLTGLMDMLKEKETPEEVNEQFYVCAGYCMCCIDSGHIDEKGTDELMQIASILCGVEMERAKKGTRERKNERAGKAEFKRDN